MFLFSMNTRWQFKGTESRKKCSFLVKTSKKTFNFFKENVFFLPNIKRFSGNNGEKKPQKEERLVCTDGLDRNRSLFSLNKKKPHSRTIGFGEAFIEKEKNMKAK